MIGDHRERVEAIIQRELGGAAGELSGSRAVTDVGIDSMNLVQILVQIEAEFGFELSDESFGELLSGTLDDLHALVERSAPRAD